MRPANKGRAPHALRFGVFPDDPSRVAVLDDQGEVYADLGEARNPILATAISEFLATQLDLGFGRVIIPFSGAPGD